MGLRGDRTRKISVRYYGYTKHVRLKLPEIGHDWENVYWNFYMLILFSFSPGHVFFWHCLPEILVGTGLG